MWSQFDQTVFFKDTQNRQQCYWKYLIEVWANTSGTLSELLLSELWLQGHNLGFRLMWLSTVHRYGWFRNKTLARPTFGHQVGGLQFDYFHPFEKSFIRPKYSCPSCIPDVLAQHSEYSHDAKTLYDSKYSYRLSILRGTVSWVFLIEIQKVNPTHVWLQNPQRVLGS